MIETTTIDQLRFENERLTKALKEWREWAQFVYLGGGAVMLENAKLREAVCEAHDQEIQGLQQELGALRAKEPPLLQCIDCKNTESPAGAMARHFNHGRCMHCGGFFKVVRA